MISYEKFIEKWKDKFEEITPNKFKSKSFYISFTQIYDATRKQADYLVPALDKEVINTIRDWKCDDDEHNSDVRAITRFCRMASGIFEEE